MNWQEQKEIIDTIPKGNISKFNLDLLFELQEYYQDELSIQDIKEFCKIATPADENKLHTMGNIGAKWTLKLDHPTIDYQGKLKKKEKEFIAHLHKRLEKEKAKLERKTK